MQMSVLRRKEPSSRLALGRPCAVDDGVLPPPRSAAPHNRCPLFQGNDQIRFELTCYSLAPQIKVRRCFSRGGARGSTRFPGQGQCAPGGRWCSSPQRAPSHAGGRGGAPSPCPVVPCTGVWVGQGPGQDIAALQPASLVLWGLAFRVQARTVPGQAWPRSGLLPAPPAPARAQTPSALDRLLAWKFPSQQLLEESGVPQVPEHCPAG